MFINHAIHLHATYSRYDSFHYDLLIFFAYIHTIPMISQWKYMWQLTSGTISLTRLHLYMYLYPIIPIKQSPLYPFKFASNESFSLDEKPIKSGWTMRRAKTRSSLLPYHLWLNIGANKVDGKKRWKQVTRGHHIVADVWAGASYPHPNPTPLPTPLPTQKHWQKASKTFSHFSTRRTDGPTDGESLL